MRTRIIRSKKRQTICARSCNGAEKAAKSFHRRDAGSWRQSFADASHSKFHFIDARAFAPHHLRVELNGETPGNKDHSLLTSSRALGADAMRSARRRSFARMQEPKNVRQRNQSSIGVRPPHTAAGRTCGRLCRSSRRPWCASVHAARDRSRNRFLAICSLQDRLGRAGAHRRAAQAQAVLERRCGMPCAASRGDRSRLLPEAESRCRAGQLFRLDRSASGSDCDRQERRRPRHGAALAQAAGAGVRRQDRGRHPWRLHARADANGFGGEQARRSQGQDRRRRRTSPAPTRTSSRSSSPSSASIRSRTWTGVPIPAIS